MARVTAMLRAWAPGRPVLVLFVCVLAPLFGFGALAEDVLEHEGFFFDEPVLLFAHQHASAWLDRVMAGASFAGSALVLVPLYAGVALFLYRQRERRRLGFWLLSLGGAALLNALAKFCFGRIRPSLWISILPETTYSFPSGHAMASMAAALAIVCLLRRQRMACLAALAAGALFVFMVGSSRVYLGVHYPSDVLAGWLASIAWVSGLAILYATPRRPAA